MLSLLGLRVVNDRSCHRGSFLLLVCGVLLSACASKQVDRPLNQVGSDEEPKNVQRQETKRQTDSLEMYVYPTEAGEEGYQVVIDL